MYKVFEVDFNRLAVLLLPTRLRQSKMIAWVKVLVSPIVSLHYNFRQKRNEDLYKLAHNGQVCYLRKALNDKFDPIERRIKITDGSRFTPQYIYTEAEQKPKYLGTMYLRDNSVYADTGVDFMVLLPFDVWNNQKTEIAIGEYRFYDVEALVDFYRLASKRYKIGLI